MTKHTTKAALEQLRADYLQRVERFAETLRPRFEAGELHGYRERDFEEGLPTRSKFKQMPAHQLEHEIRFKFLGDTKEPGADLNDALEQAAIVVLCSPSWRLIPGTADDPLICLAADAVLWDVLRIARARRWYRPTKDETPDAEDLAA